MDNITLGRIQCVRFLVKAALEMLGNSLSMDSALDPDTEKSLRINLTMAKGTLNAALTDIEQAIKNADKQSAN